MNRIRSRRGRQNNSGGGFGSNNQQPPVVVGTQATALENLKRNQQAFKYPPEGFVSQIESSLLYSMMARPDIYPADVVRQAIQQQDFTEFLPTLADTSKTNSAPVTSYAQLSALLALAAEKWPPPPSNRSTAPDPFAASASTNEQPPFREDTSTSPTSNSNNADTTTSNSNSVPQVLCKALLQTVIRHAEKHDLDRNEEVQELLKPVQRLTNQKGNQAALALVLPTYIGLGASMVTANPLPMWIGYTVSNALLFNSAAAQAQQENNLNDLTQQTNRMGNAETTSLLDEVHDEDDEYHHHDTSER